MGEIVTEEEMRRELGRFGITSGLVSCSFNLLFLLLSQPSKYIYIYMFKSYIYMKTCFMEYSFFFLFFSLFFFFLQKHTQATRRNKLLSGGQKARCSLAKLCIDRPDVLILDEPYVCLLLVVVVVVVVVDCCCCCCCCCVLLLIVVVVVSSK